MKKYEAKIDTATVQLLEEFIVECKQKEIHLILVCSPEYIEGQNFIENREQIMNIYHDWSEKYQIPFLDYSNDSICYDKLYFHNSLHLNKRGSQLFTEKLVSDLFKNNLINKIK